ncbi:orotidine-5'-phosphate decarboxylase [Blattabacterium cuenoti]|uniref:orotidine-5'-phosphate decarboxylase n=1 Tax=Blattabacterium cuenoti TaxID=1653831 RepID=UPI00163B7941|nr:orotidine-5'-phosphate decarboxylase [Blattabacterium cuenoti]
MKEKEQFFLKIYNLGIIKFGNFTLKSGMNSPIYIDFRPIASRPDLLIKLSDLLLHEVSSNNFELICGVPYAALPIATTLSLISNIPLIIKRKEDKGYGTKKMIEGIYKKGQNCLIIEDVITSGESLIKTVIDLEKEGLVIKYIMSILDREQGGTENIKKRGYNIRTLFRIGEILKMLEKKHFLKKKEINMIQFFKRKNIKNSQNKRLSYEEKKEKVSHPIGKKLIDITLKKKTNLIVSADLVHSKNILKLVNLIGDIICGLKLHVDIINDFSLSFINYLKNISIEKKFLLFEDRKLCDVGPTNYLQLHYGIYKISSWADIITAHVLAGSSSIQNLNIPSSMGLITISEMSSYGRLSDDNYIRKVLNISLKNPEVIGTVAQRKVDDRLLLFTPGIHFSSEKNLLGNTYIHPNQAFEKNGSDFIIVGKAIYQSKNPKIAAEEYRNAGWKAYENELLN